MTTLAATPAALLLVIDIDPCPWNVRKNFNAEKLRELADSLASSIGQTDAILVRPHPTQPGRFEIANGERRWRAAQLAGIVELAAKVRDLTDAEMLDIMLASGMGGNVEALSPLEEAQGLSRMQELRGFDEKQLAAHLGRPHLQVHRSLALLNLPEASAKAVADGTLSASTAWLIARIPGEEMRLKAEKAVLKDPLHGGVMTREAAKTYINTEICRTLKSAPFDPKDAKLLDSAGACTTCPFRAGNNPEVYGDVGEPHKCMSPSCFEEKVAAHRARLLAKEATGGKLELSAAENEAVFKAGEKGLAFSADYVVWNQPPTPDLLKREVSSAPKWSELCAGRGVQVHVGMHQDGYAVDIAKLAEAFAAASEPTLFNDETIRRYGRALDASIIKASEAGQEPAEIARAKKVPVADVEAVLAHHSSGPAVDSRAAEEKEEERARKKAEKAQKKKDAASASWLRELADALDVGGLKSPWLRLAPWTLLYDLAADALTPDEVAYAVRSWDQDSPIEERNRAGLDVLAHGLSVSELAALVALLLLAPRIRAGGTSCDLAKEWDETIFLADSAVAPDSDDDAPMGEVDVEASPVGRGLRATWGMQAVDILGDDDKVREAVHGIRAGEIPDGDFEIRYSVRVLDVKPPAPVMPDEERKKLTQLVLAHEGGMSVFKIARTFSMTLSDVCGALEVDEAEQRAIRDRLDEELSGAFHGVGILQAAQAPFIKFALGMVDVARADLVPEEIHRVMEALSRVAGVKAKAAIKPPASAETEKEAA